MASGDTLGIFTALDNQPPAANYATLDTENATSGVPVLDFDTTTQEIAIFSSVMPRNYAGGGITVYLHWTADTNSGTGGWDVTFQRWQDNTDTVTSESWATAQTVTAETVPGTAGIIAYSNVAITAGAAGTDSIAAGEPYRLRVRRDVATDTAAADLNLISIEIKET